MIYRTTTSGNLKSYRFNLNRSNRTLFDSMNTVITERNFSSYKEDTAAASRSFQLRNNLSQTSSQMTVGQSIVSKYEVAWSTLDTVVGDVNEAHSAMLRAANDPTGPGRIALGQELEQLSRSMVQDMNATYSGNFVFAGTDGLKAPLEMSDDGTLTYRGKNVTTTDQEMLDYLATGDVKYVDLGVGLDESNLPSTAVDSSLSAIYYLGYGMDEEDDPQNLACLAYEVSQILQRCDPNTGEFSSAEDEEDFTRLLGKFESARNTLTNRYTELDASAAYLKSNQALLEDRMYTLKEQISDLEDVDAAEAITAYQWATYCYNAALQVGNSVLSNSLMDYLNFN